MTKQVEANDSTSEVFHHDGSKKLKTQDAILDPRRLNALDACDTPVYSYHRYSLLRDFHQCHGRNVGMLVPPLLLLLLWGIAWNFVFLYAAVEIRETVESWGELINPLWVPIAFLMVFRLARAAIRFWDARSAYGKLIQTCRDMVSMAAVALNAPRRLHFNAITNRSSKSGDDERNDLLDKYARWVSAFPLAVKNYLRPRMDTRIEDLEDDRLLNEIGVLLNEVEANTLIISNHHPVLFVLDRLRELTYDICFAVDLKLHPAATAELYKQMNVHINTLSGAFGAMERICGTPLPFVYVSHLRTFLLLYLLLFNMFCVSLYGWGALIVLFAINWAMLGLEGCSVECERPFGRSTNHLPLGKFCIVIGQNIAQTLDETSPGPSFLFQ